MKDTRIRQNGGNGRWFVSLIQYIRIGDELQEQLLEMKDFANETRARNFKRKWDSEITYDRDVKNEIANTYNAMEAN